ncbi:MAG: acyl-CoA carboxylase subunit beta [Acidimicrobiales bacterium]
MRTGAVPRRGRVPGSTRASVERLAGGRRVVLVSVDPATRLGALAGDDSLTIASGAGLALSQRLPLVVSLSSSGADLHDGPYALDGWGRAARALARCSGVVPVIAVSFGLAVSGPALLLGMTDVVIMTPDAVAYLSGPAAVADLTGLRLGPGQLGGQEIHSRSTGIAALAAPDLDSAMDLAGEVLGYLPDHTDSLPPPSDSADPPDRPTPELRLVLPATDTGTYDVRTVIRAVADDAEMLELRAAWAPQLVTALVHIDGRAVGVVANQPQAMAGTLDIAAAQKGARFVSFCDTFNVALLTLVDTPGFMPGRDLEWRGMIRHGAQLVYAYAEATVPRVCLILRKAFGGAYIVMDSKAMGNDVCLAWPGAQVAVMGAQGAVQILHRRADPGTRKQLADRYQDDFLNPYVAAARGFIDQVIDPGDTRKAVGDALRMLEPKREHLVARGHGNGPM